MKEQACVVIAKRHKSNIPADMAIADIFRKKSDLKKKVWVRGEWNIRLKEGESSVKMHARLIRLRNVDMRKKRTRDRELTGSRYTGNFEKFLAMQIS